MFRVGSFVNDSSAKVLSSKLVISIVKNPIITALFTTVMIFIIILLIFSNQEAKILTLATRASFWIFLFMSGVIFLHNKVLMEECKDKELTGQYESMLNTTVIGEDVDKIIPVKITSFLE